MTACVAILNRSGAALASDSMLSASGAFDRRLTATKKIFKLSDTLPVGLMIYGAARFMDAAPVPIIDAFRRSDAKADTLQSFAETFVAFLGTYRNFDDDAKTANVAVVARAHLRRFARTVVEEASIRRESRGSAFDRLSEEIIELMRSEPYRLLGERCSRTMSKKYRRTLDVVADEVLGSAGIDFVRSRARELSRSLLASKEMSDEAMGFVVVGYGAKDWEPRLVSYQTDGFMGEHLKTIRDEEDASIGCGEGAAIAPFAQTDVIRRHLLGIDPRLWEMVKHLTTDAFASLVREIARSCHADPLVSYDRLLRQIAVEFQQRFNASRDDLFLHPVTRLVGQMEPLHLATFAEALIGMTILDQASGDRDQSVGGAIQVAQITREEGFRILSRHPREGDGPEPNEMTVAAIDGQAHRGADIRLDI